MRLTIKLKLAFAFGAVIVLSAAMAVLGITSLAAVNITSEDMLRGPVQRAQMERELQAHLLGLEAAERRMILADTAQGVDQADHDLLDRRQAVATLVGRLEIIGSPKGRQILATFNAAMQQYVAEQDHLREAVRKGDAAQARSLSLGAGLQHYHAADDILQELVTLNNQFTEAAQAEATLRYENARLLLISAMIVSLLVALGTGTWISLSISRRLGLARQLANAVAVGDLDHSVAVTSNDEIRDLIDALNCMTANLRETAEVADAIAGGDLAVTVTRRSDSDTLGIALGSMVEKLRDIVTDANGAADNVSSGSQELSASASELSEGASRAGFVDRGGVVVGGADGGQHQPECRQRQPDGKDRPPVGQGRRGQRRRGGTCGRGDADDRRENHHRAGDRPPDRPAGAERGGGSGARRRAWPRLRGGGVGSAQAGRAQPGRRHRNQHGVERRR